MTPDPRTEADDLLQEIGRSLCVTPSPYFEARVRGEVERQPPTPWHQIATRRWAVAAFSLVVAVAAAEMRGGWRVDVVSVPPPLPVQAATPALSATAYLSAPSAETPRRSPERAAVRFARARSRDLHVNGTDTPAPITRGSDPGDRVPDLTVVTDQPDLIRALWQPLHPGWILAELKSDSLPSAQPEFSPPPAIVVEAIVVPPIVIDDESD